MSAVEERIATPLPFTGELPSGVEALRKVTLPVGKPPVAEVTEAVNTNAAELEELSDVCVPAFCTSCCTAGDVLALKFASPL